jgi:hypothetical protein
VNQHSRTAAEHPALDHRICSSAMRRGAALVIAGVFAWSGLSAQAASGPSTPEAPSGNVERVSPGQDQADQLARDLAAARQEALTLKAEWERAMLTVRAAAEQKAQAALKSEKERVDALARKLAAARREAKNWETKLRSLLSAVESTGTVDRQAAPAVTRASNVPDALTSAATPLSPSGVIAAETGPDRLVGRAEELLRGGDVASARLILERAVAMGHRHAAHLLAQTYDAEFLARLKVIGLRGDPEKAHAPDDLARRAERAAEPTAQARP